jgi:arabinofuranan 3-O-arabinosyltransferase
VAVIGGRALGARAADGWAVLAGLSFLAAGLGLSWDQLVDRSWAVEWTQAWTLAALAMVAAALISTRAQRRS